MLTVTEKRETSTIQALLSDRARSYMTKLKRKSACTYKHSIRLAKLADKFASVLGLSDKERIQLIQGCYLHDIGKLSTPISILNQERALNDHEWNSMKKHPVQGARIAMTFAEEVDNRVLETILFHHERWDGRGYPDGLSGENIPYFARICAVLDAFDSMVSDRCYRKGLSASHAIVELKRNSGTQFDPHVVRCFIQYCI
ncbi:HD-GYP domain-containing protein [Xylanibacillus composti]|uniref:HD-GYP domain-containing protein n=1 Tax=Xylanibacillus composti TaxID=1572762 RepID=A0A8J4H5C2_9BACL|nr:HD-GYP domain-containing protein [Xylanibacillus composti]MDT9724825.1 HD-GYP domain-containing protein [Xylanibacillus composti]GIQ69822.1 hypothetical protein XYCOK13_26460 [Xylanibacillus composti]